MQSPHTAESEDAADYSDEAEDEMSHMHEQPMEFKTETLDSDGDESETEDDGGTANFSKTIENEMAEFDGNEDEHQTTFACYNRISCFAHLLQLVVQFDKIRPFQKVLQKAKKLVAKFNKSTKPTEKLIVLKHKNYFPIVLQDGVPLSYCSRGFWRSRMVYAK